MIKVFPNFEHIIKCPVCETNITHENLIFQGVHICSEGKCIKCNEIYLSDLPIGQANLQQYQLKKSDRKLFGDEPTEWLVKPLRDVYDNPNDDDILIDSKVFGKKKKNVILLNTIDSCFGHSLLQLFNIQELSQQNPDLGIIIIIQPFLSWLIPISIVSEVWTIPLSLSKAGNYYPKLAQKINNKIKEFDNVYFNTQLRPKEVSIDLFTKVRPFRDEKDKTIRITYIWREDLGRLWINNWVFYGVIRKLGLARMLLPLHYLSVFFLLKKIQRKIKDTPYKLTITGLGNFGKFPSSIEDLRVTGFSDEIETQLCTIYSESKLVIGIHGSSIILPSAHAQMTISVMPPKRWGNYAEDIMYDMSKKNVLEIFDKRIIPMKAGISEITDIAIDMLGNRNRFIQKFIN